jgi:hypothetical protein
MPVMIPPPVQVQIGAAALAPAYATVVKQHTDRVWPTLCGLPLFGFAPTCSCVRRGAAIGEGIREQ